MAIGAGARSFAVRKKADELRAAVIWRRKTSNRNRIHMATFTTPEKFKEHKDYVVLLKKALLLVKPEAQKKFVYYKQYPFGKKTFPLVLVDFDLGCRTAIKQAGHAETDEGTVSLTKLDELNFEPVKGNLKRIRLKKYFADIHGIKPVFVPHGETDDEDGMPQQVPVTVQQQPLSSSQPSKPTTDTRPPISTTMARKLDFEQQQFDLKNIAKHLQDLKPAFDKHLPTAKNKADLQNHWKATMTALSAKDAKAAKEAYDKLYAALALSMPPLPQTPPKSSAPQGVAPGKKDALQKQLAALDEGYRQGLKAVNFPTDDLHKAHDRVETALKSDKLDDAEKALGDLRFELKRLTSQGAKVKRLADANKKLTEDLRAAKDALAPKAGTAAAIEKQKLDPGDEFKAFIAAMKAAEKTASDANLKKVRDCAQAYVDHFEAKHANDKKRSQDPKNLEKLRLSKEWIAKVDALQALAKAEAAKGTKLDEKGIEEAQKEFGMAMISAGMGKINDTGGQSDSYKIKDTSGKNAFIFKPQKGEAPLPGMPQGAGMAREAIQSKISDEMRDLLGLDVGVAKTSIVNVNSDMFGEGNGSKDSDQVGALQEFLDSDGDAKSKLQKGDRDWINNVDRKSLESMAVLDIIMLNGDRKGDNMLIKKQTDGTTKLMPIDAGAGLPSKKTFEETSFQGFFSPCSGDESDAFGNMYNLTPAAHQPFSAETLDAIARLEPDKMRARLTAHKQQMEKDFPTTKGTIDDSTLDLSELSMRLLKRAAPLCSIVEVNYIIATKLAGLAKLKTVTDTQIDAAVQDARKAYVFMDAAASKQVEARKLITEVDPPRGAFVKKHDQGNPQRDKVDQLWQDSLTLFQQGLGFMKEWEKIADATPVRDCFDPAIAKMTEIKTIVTAG